MSSFIRLIIMDKRPELSVIYSAVSKRSGEMSYSFIDSYNAVDLIRSKVVRDREISGKAETPGHRPLIDLVVVNLVYTPEDGLEIGRKLREVCPDSKMILSSSLPISKNVEGVFDAILKKPYSSETLADTLDRIIGTSTEISRKSARDLKELVA